MIWAQLIFILQVFQVGKLAGGDFSKDGSIYRARVMPGGKLEKKNSLASLFPLAVRVHLASVKGARNTEGNRARVEARLSGGELAVCLDKRGAATFFKDGQEVVFRRPGAVAESIQTESDCEETSPEESNIEDDVEGVGLGAPKVEPSLKVQTDFFSKGGSEAEGVCIANKAEGIIEAACRSRNDSSIVDTGYLTEEGDTVESKPKALKKTLDEENAAKSLMKAGSNKSVGRKKNAAKGVSRDVVGKVAVVAKNTLVRVERIGIGEGRGRRQRRVHPKTVKAHHSGWKVFLILYFIQLMSIVECRLVMR